MAACRPLPPARMAECLNSLLRLCGDRPLLTPEHHNANDFYGHATNFKRYSKYPLEAPICAAIEHGPFIPSFAWDKDISSPLPAIFCFSQARVRALASHTTKPALALGPPILYARPALGEELFRQEKNRLGRNLLVFPCHSTHHVNVEWSWKDLIELVEPIGRDFDTVRVCMYWKDVLNGKAQTFLRLGYECVSAGHMFDPEFLPRLRSLIELSDMTLANEYGTQLGYSAVLGRPHLLKRLGIRLQVQDKNHLKDYTGLDDETLALCEAFTEYSHTLTPRQQKLVATKIGSDCFRSPEELNALLLWSARLVMKGGIEAENSATALRLEALAAIADGDILTASLLFAECAQLVPNDALCTSGGRLRQEDERIKEMLVASYRALGLGKITMAQAILGKALRMGADREAHAPLFATLTHNNR